MGLLSILPGRSGASTEGQILAGLEVPWAPSSNDDGTGVCFADRYFRASRKCRDNLQLYNEMLLQFLASSVIRGCDPKLESLPGNRECRIIGIQLLSRHGVEWDWRRFFLHLVLRLRRIGRRCLPRDGDNLH